MGNGEKIAGILSIGLIFYLIYDFAIRGELISLLKLILATFISFSIVMVIPCTIIILVWWGISILGKRKK